MDKMTLRQAIREARQEANAIIEQAERRAKGWDRGLWRDDMRPIDRNASNAIRASIRRSSAHAFALSAHFHGSR